MKSHSENCFWNICVGHQMMLHTYLLIRLSGNNKSSGKNIESCVGEYAEHSPSQLQESWQTSLINHNLRVLNPSLIIALKNDGPSLSLVIVWK